MKEQSPKKLICYLIIFFLLIIIRVFIYNAFDRNIADDTARMLVSQLFKFCIWVLPVFLYLIFIDKTNPFSFLKLTTSLKAGLLWSLGIAAACVLWQYLEIVFLGDKIGPASMSSVLGLIFIPIFEELPMRGFILQKLAQFMPFPKALFLSALLFLLAHIPGWLLIPPGLPPLQMLFNSFSVFVVVGLLGGLLNKKSNSLYPSIVLHFA
ncbi:MAG: CPBP family glutamic-type intramembrane protease, partial [Eubacteriales bacterium]